MPKLNIENTRDLLQRFDFKTLFVEELGWDRHHATLDVTVDGQTYQLTAIAEKRGMVVFVCPFVLPDYAMRRKIERRVAQSVHEHLIIYIHEDKTSQIWQWVKRDAGKPTACREHHYHRGQPGDALIQKLQTITFSLEEEAELTLVDVTRRVRTGFNLDRVTKQFYDCFKREHAGFLAFLKGIPDAEMQRWYASVMLNRLMFSYFIQKKGFLDNDANYLRTKLAQSQQRGRDGFYKAFLCPLFFEGFAKRENERSAGTNQLLGKVPYLNGGIFQRHQIEEFHGKTIQIADAAFEQLFDFFDQYQWHLDERPLRADNEINPDVLGYIFEKYINQKQMGAYYTKEDITEYISKNTIIPFLFDAARKECKIAFEGESNVWKLLQIDPDRYIYDALKKGIEHELPLEIAVGLDDVSKRTEWNKTAPDEYALPTEIWREVVARRQRYQRLRKFLETSEVYTINDLITYNLDIRQFAQDVIENCEGPELLRAFWKAINEVTILDPTCGSGAFLFAALNLLEPLYEACLERMEAFLDESQTSEVSRIPDFRSFKNFGSLKFSDFRKILDRVNQHPNRRYFIFKSIIVNNLFGVDIMEEAVEICKLRLFLKLVAQIEAVQQIEPLPDIDFNIRSGNTLVGYATYNEVKNAVIGKIDFDNAMGRIEEKAEDVERLFALFRQQQTELGGVVTADDKGALREKLVELEDELNRYLAGEYGVNQTSEVLKTSEVYVARQTSEDSKTSEVCHYEKWLASHKPFHWFIEFYGILKNGGFDVIIGNPPYVEYSKVKQEYTVRGYETESCGNLYAFMAERSLCLVSSKGHVGLIVPLPSINTERMATLQSIIKPKLGKPGRSIWVSAFDERPSNLFTGVDQRLAIEVLGSVVEQPVIATTGINRWASKVRELLFPSLAFAMQDASTAQKTSSILKVKESRLESGLLQKLYGNDVIERFRVSHRTNELVAYRTAGGRYWKVVLNQPFDGDTLSGKIAYLDGLTGCQAVALISSSMFWWYYSCHFDMYNLKDYMIFGFRFSRPTAVMLRALDELGDKLVHSIEKNVEHQRIRSKTRGIVDQKIYVSAKSKPLIDEIDRVLAQHYGFTDEELDFIINYDIKYRMGRDAGEEGE